MLIEIPDVLSRETLAQVQGLLSDASFVDGRLSAGLEARRVKHNEELRVDNPLVQRLNQLVMTPLVQHPVYQGAALPLRVAVPFYARYTPGMGYGGHVDDPIMGGPNRYRSDLSVTLFLNDPQDYDGGELVIETSFGSQAVKLPAGSAVLYPSSSWHRVAEVTAGVRLVAVTWIQSLVKDPGQRALLYQLHQARERLLRERPEAPETVQVSTAYVNLVRMWSEV
jgi:PKHD-type hydroxylase